MPIYDFLVAVAADTLLPRDRICNTFSLNDHGVGTDPTGLCEDAAQVFNAWYSANGAREIDVRAYDDITDGGPPSGRAVINTGLSPATPGPREVALCLSYYAGVNLPRHRGRMYLQPGIRLGSPPVLRPSGAIQGYALDLAAAIAGLGGADVDWIVRSRIAGGGGNVTNAWVDDEWDTQRRRGLKPTGRSTRAIGA